MESKEINIDSIREWAGQAAGDLMLLECKDIQGLAIFSKRIEEYATGALDAEDASGTIADYAKRLQEAASTLKSIILDKVEDKEDALSTVAKTIEAGQYIGSPAAAHHPPPPHDAPAASKEAPEASSDQAQPPTSEDSYQPWVDDAIMAAYTEQQLSVLPEMEHQIISLESDAAPEQLSALRRHIHTLKGESGVVGAMHIENVCHRIEDYIDHCADRPATDVLLAVLDWIGIAVRQLATDGSQHDPTPILELLDRPTDDSTAEAQDAPHVPESSPAAEPAATDAPAASPEPEPVAEIAIADPELAADFVVEAQEHFDAADEHLLILERDPTNADSIGAVFRAFHTLKGVAGFLGLTPLGDLAHAAETLLDEVRKGKRHFSGPAVQATFNALDLLKVMVTNLGTALDQGGGFPIPPELDAHISVLHAITDAPADKTDSNNDDASISVPPVSEAPPSRQTPDTPTESTQQPTPPPASNNTPAEDPSPPAQMVETTQRNAGTRTSVEAAQTMKVEAARIDLLLDTIGELVIAEAIVAGDPEIRAIKSLRVERNLALLSKITRSLQDMGMSMRLVPIDPIFRKMARLVRDLSHKSGKKVELQIEGGDTELDKSMVDKLGDPLVHMIRNSMDHGLEGPDERVAAGKPQTGHILLKAYHKGGSIHIDIRDDGRGLNRDAIVKKAIERGIITSSDGMSEGDIFNLIFEPGFSTAAKITEISGRGVGMDVVKRNIEMLHGNVLVASEAGNGSTFTLALPLTTAIIDGMLSRVGTEVFILPTLSVIESFRPAPHQVHPVSAKGELIAFRGELIPLHRLSHVLKVPNAETDVLESIVIIIEEFGKHWALMVDELLGQQQIVIKNIGDGIGEVQGVAGASILADGRPGLILDTAGVIKLASEQSKN